MINNISEEPINIKNTPINEKAYVLLKEFIIKQKLEPNKELNEKELAELLGISRTPLREALKKLEVDGFIVRNSNKRIKISQLSIDHAKNLYMVRSRLEGLSASMAAQNITDLDIDRLEQLLDQSSTYRNNKEFEKFDDVGREFHKIIHEVAANEVCLFMLRTLSDHINRYRWISIRTLERPKKIIEEHQELINCFKKGDIDLAEYTMKQHIIKSGEMVVKELEEYL